MQSMKNKSEDWIRTVTSLILNGIPHLKTMLRTSCREGSNLNYFEEILPCLPQCPSVWNQGGAATSPDGGIFFNEALIW